MISAFSKGTQKVMYNTNQHKLSICILYILHRSE